MHKPTPTPSFSEIDAFRASILLGLVRVLAALGDLIALPRALKQLLRDQVFRAERCAQAVIVLLALKRGPLRARSRGPRRPRSFRTGFRLKRTRATNRRRALRVALRGTQQGTLPQRIARVVDALRNPEAHIARVLKLIAGGLYYGSLVAVAPPSLGASAPLTTRAAAIADSS